MQTNINVTPDSTNVHKLVRRISTKDLSGPELLKTRNLLRKAYFRAKNELLFEKYINHHLINRVRALQKSVTDTDIEKMERQVIYLFIYLFYLFILFIYYLFYLFIIYLCFDLCVCVLVSCLFHVVYLFIYLFIHLIRLFVFKGFAGCIG
jgi:hypothetical protein